MARSSCVMPIAVFATRIPRKSASRGSPAIRIAAPATARIALNSVKTFARTMLDAERLDEGARAGPRSASLRAASASVSTLAI